MPCVLLGVKFQAQVFFWCSPYDPPPPRHIYCEYPLGLNVTMSMKNVFIFLFRVKKLEELSLKCRTLGTVLVNTSKFPQQ